MLTRRRLLYVMTWLTDFALMSIVFTVSRTLADQGAGLLKLGWVGGGLSLAMAVFALLGGGLSDRFGRRGLMLLGIVTIFCSALLCAALRTDQWGYYAAYFACAAGAGMAYPPIIAWLNQGRDHRQGLHAATRTLVVFCLSWNAGMICGQLTSGWLIEYAGRNWPLYLAMTLSAANLALLTLVGRAPSTPVQEDVPAELIHHRALARSFVRLCWIANLGGAFSMSMIFHLFPQLAVSLGIPPDLHGIMLAISRAVIIGTYLVMHRVHFWHFRFSPAVVVHATAIVGLLTLATATTPLVLTLGLTGLAVLLGYNYFASLYYSTAGSTDEAKGAASGMHEATLALGFAVGSVGGGLAGAYVDARAPYQLAALVIALSITVQIALYFSRVRPLRDTLR